MSLNRDQTQFLTTLKTDMQERGKYYTIYEYNPENKKHDRIKFSLEPIISNNKMFFIKDE